MQYSLSVRRQTGYQYILDKLTPMSPFGAELMRSPEIYEQQEALQAELGRVSALMALPQEEGEPFFQEIDRLLMCLKDIRASLRRCAGGGTLSLEELFEVKGLLLALEGLGPLCGRLGLEGLAFSPSGPALDVLDPSGERRRPFTIDDAATPELFEIRRRKRAVEGELYRCEDPARQTELKLARDEICAQEDQQERQVRAALSSRLAPHCPGLLEDCLCCGRLDVLLRKASMGRLFGASVPELGGDAVVFEEMTDPEVAGSLQQRGGRFTPLSLCLRRGATVITGANMGGKTVALKTLALNVMLAMTGFPVCARTGKLPMIGKLLFLSGDAQKTQAGLSTFGGEVVRLREAAEACGPGTLLLLDEPARGTNPDEGAAIVRGLTQYLNDQPSFAVLSTHYDGVAPLASGHYRIKGLRDMDRDAVRRELAQGLAPGPEIIARHMDYGLYPAGPAEPCPREALDICRLLGMPQKVMAKIENFY